jgi:hypothetical protein
VFDLFAADGTGFTAERDAEFLPLLKVPFSGKRMSEAQVSNMLMKTFAALSRTKDNPDAAVLPQSDSTPFERIYSGAGG